MENILIFPDDKYDDLMQVMEENGRKADDIAMCVQFEDFNTIILRESFVDESDDDVIRIVVEHELAHASGIIGEEEADRKALENLNEYQRGILIEAWEERHGRKYKEN